MKILRTAVEANGACPQVLTNDRNQLQERLELELIYQVPVIKWLRFRDDILGLFHDLLLMFSKVNTTRLIFMLLKKC